MNTKIVSIIVGISFKKAFRILDDAGAIFDDLLYEKPSHYFPNQYFPQIEYGGFQKVLKNDDTGDYLHLHSDNVVYCHNIKDNEKSETVISQVKQRVEEAIVPAIIAKHELAVSRLGIVYTVETSKEKLQKFKSKFFKDDVDVSAFRFSVADGTSKGSIEKDLHDYYNTIYTISKENDRYLVSFDFQQYFRPLKPTWRECHSSDFFAKAMSEFQTQLLKDLE